VSQNYLPTERRKYLGKCDNLNFKEKKSSQGIIQKRHPKLDQSELRVGGIFHQVKFSLIIAMLIIIFAV
jgi:hypothetical protein